MKTLSLSQFSRDTKLLIAASGLFAISFFGIHTLLTVLYILRLGYGLEYLGWVNAVSAFTYMAMSLPSGALGARFDTRTVMLSGGAATVTGMAILPLTEFVPFWAQDAWPIISQMIRTGGWAMFSISLVPTLMAATTDQNRNNAYALNGTLKGLGTFVGTICGGLLPGLFAYLLSQSLDMPAPYRLSLWVGAVLGLVGLVPLSLIKPHKPVAATVAEEQADGPFPVLSITLIVAYVYISNGGWATCQTFCSAFMDTDLHLSASSIALITGLGQFAAIFAPLLAPRLATRYGNGWTLVMTAMGTAISLAPLTMIPHWTTVALGRLGVLALSAIRMPALQVFQMELVKGRWRSLAYGIVSMAMGLSFGTISLAGGYIAAEWGYRRLFLLGIGLSLVGGTLMWSVLKTPALTNPEAMI